MTFLQKQISPQGAREYEEKLFLGTNAFFHGEWGASRINQLLLYCKNLENAQHSKVINENLNRYIAKYFELVLPEIEKIQEYAKKAGLEQNIVHNISNYNKELMERLLHLKTELGLNHKIKSSLLEKIIDSASMLLYHLSQLRKTILGSFSCEVVRIAEDLVKLMNQKENIIELKIDIKRDSMAIIRPSDFSQILQNLVKNAITAVENSQIKNITTSLTASLDYIFIKVNDTGTGIGPEIKEQLFKEQTSTKTNGGGFGLYYSQNVLKKYGGKIRIVKSIQGQGTEIELLLKRV